jgi:hypothetical protein
MGKPSRTDAHRPRIPPVPGGWSARSALRCGPAARRAHCAAPVRHSR